MYGTVARLRVKPGQEEALVALNQRWLRERKPEAAGFIADYALKADRGGGEWFVLVIFDSEKHYRQNAADPEQHRLYEAMRALLESDPEWSDGEILSVEPATVPL